MFAIKELDASSRNSVSLQTQEESLPMSILQNTIQTVACLLIHPTIAPVGWFIALSRTIQENTKKDLIMIILQKDTWLSCKQKGSFVAFRGGIVLSAKGSLEEVVMWIASVLVVETLFVLSFNYVHTVALRTTKTTLSTFGKLVSSSLYYISRLEVWKVTKQKISSKTRNLKT